MVVEKPASTSAAELAAARLLVESAQQDRSKFADLYDKYFYLVYAYTARRVADRATAEDLTSEVFQKALEYLPKLMPGIVGRLLAGLLRSMNLRIKRTAIESAP